MRRVVLTGSVAAGAMVLAWLAWIVAGGSQSASSETWNADAIRATLETVVPAHNDVSFLYVLENRTDADYRIAHDSEVTLLARSRSTGDFVPGAGEHMSGEFPLTVPARRKVHFALVWTANREIDPALTPEFVSNLDVKSFVVLDQVRRYRIECPTSQLMTRHARPLSGETAATLH